jgi:hypothetical protein
MGIYNQFDSMVQFIFRSSRRLFSPTDDAIRDCVQPFGGELFIKLKELIGKNF